MSGIQSVFIRVHPWQRSVTMNTPILEMTAVGKRFPGVVALDNVSLSVGAGEIVALIGENGAGKSTLMKILGGAITRDSGTIKINNQPVDIRSPREASALASRGERMSTGWLLILIVPLSRVIAPPRIFISVDLPAPFSPMSATISPAPTLKLTLSSATTPGNRLPTAVISSMGVFIVTDLCHG